MQGEGSTGARVLAGIAWVVAAVALLLVSALIHLRHPVARRMIVRAVEQAVASGSEGVLRIGRLDEASLDGLKLANVTYWDVAEKRKALSLDDVDVRLDADSLWSDQIHVTGVRIHGGDLVLQKSWKRPERGFMPKLDAPRELRQQGMSVRVDDIAFDDLHVLAILDATPYELGGLAGRATASVEERATIELEGTRGTLTLPGQAGQVELEDVAGTIPYAPSEGGLARASGKVVVAGAPTRAELTYHDRDEPPPLEVQVSSDAFTRQQLARLGLPAETLEGVQPPAAGSIRYTGTFQSVELAPELEGAAGSTVELAEPVRLEAQWKLSKGKAAPPASEGGVAGPALLFVFLSILLAALVIVQVAMMVWLVRRGEARPWWRMLPVATSVAVWTRGGRSAAAAWWALLAVYLALVIGAA